MPHTYLNQHAHDIAFAVFRVAALIRHPKLKTELEGAAVELIARMDAVYVTNGAGVSTDHRHFHHHERLKWLIRLSESVGEMRSINAAVLCREIDNLQSAMIEVIGNLATEDISLDEELFIALEGIKKEEKLMEAPATQTQAVSVQHKIEEKKGAAGVRSVVRNEAPARPADAVKKGVPVPQGLKPQKKVAPSQISPDERQNNISQIIRQMPNGCRMRDLMSLFPEVSERTLRNDLQALVKQGIVERFGSQGPYSYFRAVTKSGVFAL